MAKPKNGFKRISTKIVLLIILALVISNSVLCFFFIANSRTAIRKSIRQRMLDISNCAAGSVNGDILETIVVEDKDSPEYNMVYNSLAIFRDNVELEYVYGIRDEGNGVFSFTVDPALEDPAEFGSPVEYTAALDSASKGTPSVDETPYEDAWGRFYSAYSPVFDSSGNVAGIIGVDFSEDWFDGQIESETRNIILTYTAILTFTLVVGLIVSILLVRSITSPLKKIGEVAEQYENGDFSARLEIDSDDEVGDLSRALQSMSATLKKQVDEKIYENEQLFLQVVRSLADAIDAKDTYTNGHSGRVADYSKEIARRYGYSEEDLNSIYMMGLLHDVGKIGVPDEVINKTSRLTDEEFALIKTHPVIGSKILENIKNMPKLAYGARWHHERYGGGGYPDGLKGEEIPEEARIIAVADAYDAMTSNRSYRNVMPQEKVREQIEKGKGSQFDPAFADIMLAMIDEDTSYSMREGDKKAPSAES